MSRMPATETHLAYVGSRTTRERGASGEGLSIFATDAGSRHWRHIKTVRELVNPSFLAFGRGGRHLYVVHGDGTEVSAFAIDEATGLLHFLGRVACGGRNPVHLVASPCGRRLFVANHLSSTVAAIEIAPDGTLGAIAQSVTLAGEPGPHRSEQPFAKPHQVILSRDERFLIVPDKGLDATFTFAIGRDGGLRPMDDPIRDREASGARHAVCSPDGRHVYVVNELDSTVSAFAFDEGRLAPVQRINALPDSFFGFSRAAGIVLTPDGRHLFASNRGHDSLAGFTVDPGSGRLTANGITPCGGRTPRFIALAPDASAVICANEESHTLTRLEIGEAGNLRPAAEIAQVRSPVCVVWKALPA